MKHGEGGEMFFNVLSGTFSRKESKPLTHVSGFKMNDEYKSVEKRRFSLIAMPQLHPDSLHSDHFSLLFNSAHLNYSEGWKFC